MQKRTAHGLNETVGELVDGVLAGKRRSVARAITVVENGAPGRDELLGALTSGALSRVAPGIGPAARVIGITGPPGAGKSTLLSGLIGSARDARRRVAVLAVDPTSPFSGGALLGDRIRMSRHGDDDGVFIRSMATRGHHGGLSAAALDTVTILSAAGYDDVFVESVGVGQSEVGILGLADVVLLVLNPGAGDEIQALKAGVMEIGDIYVINKTDYPGVASLERDLREVCDNATRHTVAPVTAKTVASTGEGVTELYETIHSYHAELDKVGELTRRRQNRLADAVADAAADMVRTWVKEQSFSAAPGDVPLGELRRRLAGALETISTNFGGSHDGDN